MDCSDVWDPLTLHIIRTLEGCQFIVLSIVNTHSQVQNNQFTITNTTNSFLFKSININLMA